MKKVIKFAGIGIGCVLAACIILELLLEQIYGISGSTSIKRAIPIRENLPGTEITASRDEYYNGIYGVHGVFEGLGDYHAKIDLNGFIEPSKRYEDADKTILFLGGSTTECITVSDEMRYPYLVGKELEKETGYQINSYNAGVGGGNSHNSIDTLLHKGLRLQPDVAVLHHDINDLVLLLKHGDYCYTKTDESFDFYYMQTAGTASVGGARARINNILHQIFPALSDRIGSINTQEKVQKPSNKEKTEYDKSAILKSFRNNLELFISICEINDITPVLMTQAARMDEKPDKLIAELYEACSGYDLGIEYDEFYILFKEMNNVIRKVAAEQNITCIDLEHQIEKTPANFIDMVHYTDEGSAKAAEIITKNLKKAVGEE